ncbi:P1 family peptidase [Nakamurella lactea]|uniref:P1 family peptidase n=1 Tax=Nakamurella lactea TaxID=459515 RepID=UPI000408A3C4|nr:P1 family peptidase [Nakamurella lactea]
MSGPGPSNSLTDVEGLRVGHVTMAGDGYLTGTTVVLGPDAGMVAGADVRGGAPGTRETDLLDPSAAMERINAIVLTGGSAFGLAAADGVANELADRGIGFRVGSGDREVVPIVPAAVLFDLGRGGTFRATPDAETGRLAVRAALAGSTPEQGCVGAGTGAAVAHLKGGVGTASIVLDDGTTVAALVVVNAIGSPVDPLTGALSGARLLHRDDVDALIVPAAEESAAVLEAARPRGPVRDQPFDAQVLKNTTVGVIATDATLTKAQCRKLAGIGHDGLARTVNPVHTLLDGDSLFGLSTERRPPPDPVDLHEILCAAGDLVSRAVIRAILAATGTRTEAGYWPAYTDLAPSAVGRYPDPSQGISETEEQP